MLAWSQLNVWLCQDIPEPTPETTMLDFLNQLEGKAGIWQDMANSHFESRQWTSQQHYLKHSDTHYKCAPTHIQCYQLQPFIQLQISPYTPPYGQPAPQWQTGFLFNSAWQGWQPTWQPGNNWQQTKNQQNWQCQPNQPWRQGNYNQSWNNNANHATGQQQVKGNQLAIVDKPWNQNIPDQPRQPWN